MDVLDSSCALAGEDEGILIRAFGTPTEATLLRLLHVSLLLADGFDLLEVFEVLIVGVSENGIRAVSVLDFVVSSCVHVHFLAVLGVANLFNCKLDPSNLEDVSLTDFIVLTQIWLI